LFNPAYNLSNLLTKTLTLFHENISKKSKDTSPKCPCSIHTLFSLHGKEQITCICGEKGPSALMERNRWV